MTHSHSSGTLGTNQEAIAAFNERFADELPEIGTTLVLPEQGQHLEVIGCRTWRSSTYFIFASKCMQCGEPYSFEAERGSKMLLRTCLADRGKWRADATPLFPKQALFQVLEAHRLIADRVHVDQVIKQVVEKLPLMPGRPDKRKASVIRSLTKTVRLGGLDCEFDGEYFIF